MDEEIERLVVSVRAEARGVAEAALVRRIRERGRTTVRCGWARLPVSPGTIVRLPDAAGLWRVLAGANLALIGNELIQFGRAVPLGEGCWRLSELTRGRRGTGWAAADHIVGERFVLIDQETLLAYDPPLSVAGADVQVLASGIGDPAPVTATASSVGEALRPPTPVHLNAERREDEGFGLRWSRQSRTGWSWLDACDAPLSEDNERYRLTIRRGDGAERTYDIGTAAFDYATTEVTADAMAGTAVTISVVQIGTSAASRPASITLDL